MLAWKWQHFTRNIQNFTDLLWQMLSEVYGVCSLKLFEGHGHKEQLDALPHLNHTGCVTQPDWCSLTITFFKGHGCNHICISYKLSHTDILYSNMSKLTCFFWLCCDCILYMSSWFPEKNKNNYCNELLSCCQVLQASIWHDCLYHLSGSLFCMASCKSADIIIYTGQLHAFFQPKGWKEWS